MISQNRIKLINSLSKKKFRDINHLFIAEGEKLVKDLYQSGIKLKWIYCLDEWIENHTEIKGNEIIRTSNQYLKKISQLKTPPPVIAICEIPQYNISKINFSHLLTIVLDDIQDPGNMGTIIRLADWFGIENIICSKDTVDAYNPKVIQATMGAIASVKVHYTDLVNFFNQEKNNTPIFGTFLDGDDIYNQKLSENGFIVMGNEGQGISSEIETLVSNKLLIPNFSGNKNLSESLNVSTATAITLSEFKRRKH